MSFLAASKSTDAIRMAALHKSQAIIEFKTDGTIVDANENFCKTLGYEPGEIRGKHHSIFIDPKERESDAYKAFWTSLRSGKFLSAEYRRIGKGGKVVWIQASYNPVIDASGQITVVLKIATDITAQKLKSIEDEGQMDAINRSQAVIHFSPDGTILDANTNFLSALGYELSDIKGKKHAMFVPRDEQGAEYVAFWEALRKGQFQTAEFRRIGRGGREVWIQASYNPIFDSNGHVCRVVKFATDITEQVKLRLEREQATIEIDKDLVRILEAVTSAASQITEASAAARETSLNVENVATGSTQLANSVQEISGQVAKASQISAEAVTKVQNANTSISSLSDSTQQIGQVVKLISDIAAQTNLLALNATIEAARAGEAGRGFAVVAGEVKALASQSAKATEDISRQIGSVQAATSEAVQAIQAIAKVIEEVNNISLSISGAVEEQACVTRDISTNMGDATMAVNNISQGVDGIAEATNLIKDATEQVKLRSAGVAR